MSYFTTNPSVFSSFELKRIVLVALILRIIAAIFSQGYGMHDDHFLIIEAAASWVDGYDYNNWLPWSEANKGPDGHSFTYVGINFILFKGLDFLGIDHPYWMMIINRIVHAIWGTMLVVWAIKIADKLVNRKVAIRVGWLLALLWIAPFISVRNLVEMTAAPWLLWGFYYVARNRSKWDFLWAGIILGMAVSFRYQTGVFLVGMAAVLIFQVNFTRWFLMCAGILITFVLTQGVVDYAIWGTPFAEFLRYVEYNMNEGTQYMQNDNYFMYLYVLFGVFLLPLGLWMMVAFFLSWKKSWLLFVPSLLFLLFHSWFPNRQERFIITILPFVLIAAIWLIEEWKQKEKWQKMIRYSYTAFWVLNIPLMVFFSVTSTKVSRVKAMATLYENGMRNEHILLEGSHGAKIRMMPKFYGKAWSAGFAERSDADTPLLVHPEHVYDYIFFFGEESLDARIERYKAVYPRMKLLSNCQPSWMDRVLHTLNPRNANENIQVWQTHAKRN